MKRLLACAFAAGVLAAPAGAFHHGPIPATDCAADAAGSPSNDNGEAKEALTTKAGQTVPLPPFGGPAHDNLEGNPSDQRCANA